MDGEPKFKRMATKAEAAHIIDLVGGSPDKITQVVDELLTDDAEPLSFIDVAREALYDKKFWLFVCWFVPLFCSKYYFIVNVTSIVGWQTDNDTERMKKLNAMFSWVLPCTGILAIIEGGGNRIKGMLGLMAMLTVVLGVLSCTPGSGLHQEAMLFCISIIRFLFFVVAVFLFFSPAFLGRPLGPRSWGLCSVVAASVSFLDAPIAAFCRHAGSYAVANGSVCAICVACNLLMLFYLRNFDFTSKSEAENKQPLLPTLAKSAPTSRFGIHYARWAAGCLTTLMASLETVGYQAMLPVFYKERVFIETCTSNEIMAWEKAGFTILPACNAQQGSLTLMVTVGVAFINYGNLPANFFMVRVGGEACQRIGLLLKAFGYFIFAASTNKRPWWTWGYAIISMGGAFVNLPMNALGTSMFPPSMHFRVLGCKMGCLDASCCMFLIGRTLHESFGFSLERLCLGYMVLCLILGNVLVPFAHMDPELDEKRAKQKRMRREVLDRALHDSSSARLCGPVG